MSRAMQKSTSFKIHPLTMILYLILLVFSFLCVAPFIYIISMSVSTEEAIGQYGLTFIPRAFSLESYQFILQYGDKFYRAFAVSLILAIGGTFLSVIVTAGLAYPLSRKYLPYRGIIMKAVLFTMLFNGGLISSFLLIRYLGLYNSMWALILPSLVASFYMILMRNFFATIPESIIESALCDGANDLQIFFRIVLPTSGTILATIALFYAVGYWNSWFQALLFMSDSSKWPAMTFLRSILMNFNNPSNAVMSNPLSARPPSESLRMACVIIITAPILLSYPFAQKYFVKGVMLGSVKG